MHSWWYTPPLSDFCYIYVGVGGTTTSGDTFGLGAQDDNDNGEEEEKNDDDIVGDEVITKTLARFLILCRIEDTA